MSHQIIPNLLGVDGAADLLAYAIANESHFTETLVGAVGQNKPGVRKSRRLSDLGPYRELIERSVWPLIPGLITDLKLTQFQATELEIELVAHEDGAFYSRHLDLFTGSSRSPGDRLISLVCYLNEQPKCFTGGELRLYPQLKPAEISDKGAIDIAPDHGLAVAFSSWLPHEVRPVACHTGQFRHSRFAINCWVLRSNEAASTVANINEGPGL